MNRHHEKKSGGRNFWETLTAPKQSQGNGVRRLWNDFEARYRRNEMTDVDKVIAAVVISVLLFIVFPIMIKLMVWIVMTPRDIAEEWMERAHDCERRNISLLVAVASVSCNMWLLYILHLTQKHASATIRQVIEKMEAQKERDVTLAKNQNLNEVNKILRERDMEMEAKIGFKISNGIGRIASLMTGLYEGIQSLFKSTSEMKAASDCKEAK